MQYWITYQDMKNFLNITAIDTSQLLEIYVELKEHNIPQYNFTVNDTPVINQTVHRVDLLQPIKFGCFISSGAVEVVKITINGHEVLPIYQHLADPATNWITGDWTFKIPGPFYPWYHQITGQGWTA